MFGIEVVGATLLPFASLRALLGNFLLLRAPLLNWLLGLPLIDSLVSIALLLATSLLRVLILLLLLGALRRVPVLLLLLSLLPVLILRLLLRVLLRGRFLLFLLSMLLRPWLGLLLLSILLCVPVLLVLLDLLPVLNLRLLLRVLLRGRFLLLLGMLLRAWLPLLLLRVLLRRWFFLLLLGGRLPLFLAASLLRLLCLPVGLFLLVAFLILLRVPEYSRPKKYYENRCPNNLKLSHRYFLVGSMNAWERECCTLLDIS